MRQHEEDDLRAELDAHLAIEARERRESGQSPDEAAHAAQRVFGNTTRIQEEIREGSRWTALERFRDDLRFGVRMLRKTPLWTAIICATLALGVGLSTAIFSVVYGVLLQPLPYPESDRLIALWPSAPGQSYARFNVSAALWLEWKKSTLIEDIALTRTIANFNLTGIGAPERLQGGRTTANLFAILRTAPLMGRTFTEAEQRSGARVTLLSHAFWVRRFGADAAILGRRVQLNGEPHEVIGVMPPEFRYPAAEFELWTPLYIPPDEIHHGANYQYVSVGRMKPGVAAEQAHAEIGGIMRRLAAEYPQYYRVGRDPLGTIVEPLAQSDAAQVRTPLYVLLGAVACLLTIGCMNLAVLLIARSSARAREMAVRVALGASGGRLRRQLLAEVLPLAAAGIAGGLVLALWLLRAMLPYLPSSTPRVAAIGLHGPVVAFAVALSLAVVILASLLPARMAARSDPGGALHQSSRSVTGGGGARDVLVVAQITVTLILVFGALLFARSFAAMVRVSPGFASDGVLTIHLAVTRARHREDTEVAEYYRRIIEGTRRIPGVVAAGFVNRLPFSGIAQTGGVEFEGREASSDSDWRSATPGYFEAMDIPIKQGRAFTESDTARSPAVGIIDEKLAREIFGSESPIGKRFRRFLRGLPQSQQDPWSEIVGVAGHILNDSLERDPRPQVYWPETQRTQDRAVLVVRTAGKPELLAPSVIAAIHGEDPDQPVYDVRSMNEWIGRASQGRALMTAVVAVFGGASLLLACIGLYGVVSYSAELRFREFGIRMALGAGANQVRRIVLAHAGKLAMGGAAIGLVLAWPVSRGLESQLFGVTRGDAISWLLAPAVLVAVAIVAGLAPAGRAAKADPAITLRAD